MSTGYRRSEALQDRRKPRTWRWGLVVSLLLAVLLPASAGRGETSATTTARPWLHEEEFAQDPAVRATPDQVVILHLEPAAKGGKPILNTIPYLFEKTATFNFCVPKGDPHIRSLELVREGSHGVVVHVPRGAPCKTMTVAAGLYQLHVYHDGSAIAANGEKAFVHVPRQRRVLSEGDVLGSFPSSCDLTMPLTNPLFTFAAVNGKFVAAGQADGSAVAANASGVGLATTSSV